MNQYTTAEIKWDEATYINLDTSPQWHVELSGEKQKDTSSMLAFMSIFERQNMEVYVLWIPVSTLKV